MAGKAKGVPRDTAVTLRLPRELHDHLKKVARGRSVSEEIRVRLEWSLLHDLTSDQKTRDLVDSIGNIARNIRPYFGDWHANPYAFAIIKVAIDTLLTKLQPKGKPKPPPDDGEF